MNKSSHIFKEKAECNHISENLLSLGKYLDQYLELKHDDAFCNKNDWKNQLDHPLPEQGVGIKAVISELGNSVILNGSAIPKPGFSSFITTGATTVGALATLAGSIAAPQRIGLNAFNYLETVSLNWMAELFGLNASMKGIYSSGGSVANLLALGAARQSAFEKIGVDVAKDGATKKCRIYASQSCHNTINRAAAVLGLGRSAVVAIATDQQGILDIEDLREKISNDLHCDTLPIAIVANAGSTSTGAIDPLKAIASIAQQFDIWFHVDGAYGLPGILDPQITHLYQGIELADSVIVDPHKWLGAPVGIGATYVKDYGYLFRAFTQENADYLEGSVYDQNIEHSMDNLGIPFNDLGVELSAPCRGAVVWAMLKEIGKQGMIDRVCRHNEMARYLAELARKNRNLELLIEPSLSICCFRYTHPNIDDLNFFNRAIHRQLLRNNKNLPSTTMIGEDLALRPCFVGARTDWIQAVDLATEVVAIGDNMIRHRHQNKYAFNETTKNKSTLVKNTSETGICI